MFKGGRRRDLLQRRLPKVWGPLARLRALRHRGDLACLFWLEFPQAVRDALVGQKNRAALYGGIEKDLSLTWIVCGSQIFIWNLIPSPGLKQCVVLDISNKENETNFNKCRLLISFVDWGKSIEEPKNILGEGLSVGLVACCQETGAVIYWVDIFSDILNKPVFSIPRTEDRETSQRGNNLRFESKLFNSLLACPIPNTEYECVGLSLRCDGELWRFCCSPSMIIREKISSVIPCFPVKTAYAKSLLWRLQHKMPGQLQRQFFLLTDHEIQCWNVVLASGGHITELFSHELMNDIKKDLDEKNLVLPLDMQVDSSGKIFKVLVATLYKGSSSYTQYSLLTLQYKPGFESSSEDYSLTNEGILEKQGTLDVLIPKGRVEDEEILLSMRLRVGERPPGSVFILSKSGTATLAKTHGKDSAKLYQFELPWDAGKVVDASTIEEVDWVVLTEKAGIWAVPQNVVFNREDSDDRVLKVANSAVLTAQDEEAEALLNILFQDFVATGKVEGVLEKLKKNGAFDKNGSVNVFVRMSQSIVDTLAKHWTTNRGSDLLASAVFTSQLLEKQQKHKRFLQFLALSKCHEELCSRQGASLQIILEHGEKLCSMIKLRELQNQISQNRSGGSDSPSSPSLSDSTSSLWDLIQLVGEKARRNAVLLMDRDNAEVFYSRVSELEELFYYLSHSLQFIIDQKRSLRSQIQRTCEISNACTSITLSAIRYRNDHQAWYPSLDGLNQWTCESVVRSGLWSIVSLIIQYLDESNIIDKSSKLDLSSCLERLSEVLLDGYSSFLAAKMGRGEDYKALLEEYCRRRDEILCTLYQQLKDFVDNKCQEASGIQDPDLRRSLLEEASLHLLSIAKRHAGYQTLWDICFDLDNTDLLRKLMRESMGPQGGFSYFVFDKFYSQGRFSILLRLGEEFQEELLIFLQRHKDLIWIHEIFMNRFSSASENLYALALSQDNDFSLMAEESSDTVKTRPELSLSDRRRHLNLSKIAAAAAGGDASSYQNMQRVEAELHLLGLQGKIATQFDNVEAKLIFSKLLDPKKLIELCLDKSKTQKSLILRTFEIFAWTTSAFRASNKSLLCECWMNVADQDNWQDIHQDLTAEGWSDEMITDFLSGTYLFQASRICYGPNAEVYDGGFDDVLPLLGKDMIIKGTVSSVESILMQHRAFPDAGKLMLTALVMGQHASGGTKDDELMSEI
ncbi:nucleoporin, Nup133/Nup155-like protein isoform X2 [Wolffia australiana]